MPVIGKRLGATTVVAATPTILYTCPAATETDVVTVVACNTGATAHTFRMAHDFGGLGVTLAENFVYDATIEGNTAYSWTGTVKMQAGDTLVVQADHAEVVFSAWGNEHS
jgi:hypothetical protein